MPPPTTRHTQAPRPLPASPARPGTLIHHEERFVPRRERTHSADGLVTLRAALVSFYSLPLTRSCRGNVS